MTEIFETTEMTEMTESTVLICSPKTIKTIKKLAEVTGLSKMAESTKLIGGWVRLVSGLSRLDQVSLGWVRSLEITRLE